MTADDATVERVVQLRDELVRPEFVFTMGRARMRSSLPRVRQAGETAARRAAAEIDAIVRQYCYDV